MTRTTFRFLTAGLALLLLMAVAAPVARADELNISLTTSNLSGYAPGTVFGTVNLKLVGDQIVVTVTAGSGFTFAPGQEGAALNVLNPGSLAISNLTSGWGQETAGNMDGFGKFNLRFSGPTTEGGSFVSTMTFTISRAGGFTSVTQLLDPNNKNAVAAIHFRDPNRDPGANTGFASNGGSNVPEPGTLLLFGSGILMFGGALRRRLSS